MSGELQQTLDDGRVEYNAPAQSERQYVPNRVRSGIPPMKIDAPTSGVDYASVFYKKTNSDYGSTAPPEGLQLPRHGKGARFSNYLATAGMYRNNGLVTKFDHGRFLEGNKDWMLKNA